MTIYKKRTQARVYRSIYEKHYGPIPREENGRSYEIHHIDGDHTNNDPLNLKAVTIQEHYDIHYSQQDWGACIKIGAAMKLDPKEISVMASIHSKKVQKERLENGTHHFLNSEYQTKINKSRVQNKTHNLLGSSMSEHQFKTGTHPSQQVFHCENCNRDIKNKSNYNRWHENNCKSVKF
jgi:hypothetical protein